MTWHSLLLPFTETDAIAQILRESLVALGYELYDPFSLMPGKAYTQSVRLFIAPAHEGWTRILGAPDEAMLPTLSQKALCLSLSLIKDTADIHVFAEGAEVDTVSGLIPYLHDGATVDDLGKALKGDFVPASRSAQDEVVPMNVLPDDIQQMAKGLNTKQINKLFGKLMKQVNRQTTGDEKAARALLAGDTPDWDSMGGRRIRAVMNCLNIPANWNTPDFVTLRDAYQLHVRRQRNPNAPLYPGDSDAMAKVADALSYRPIYGGK